MAPKRRQATITIPGRRVAIVRVTFISIISILTLSACVKTSYIDSPTDQPPNLSSYDRIRVKVTSDIQAEREIQMIEALTVARLSKAKLFDRVTAASRTSAGDEPLLLHASMIDLEKVGSGTRLAWGVLAGIAGVELRVELIDRTSQKSISDFVTGSNAFGGTFGATTSDTTIDLIVNKIVDYVIRGKTMN